VGGGVQREWRPLLGAWTAVPRRLRQLVVDGLALWCGVLFKGWGVVGWQTGGWGQWRWLEGWRGEAGRWTGGGRRGQGHFRGLLVDSQLGLGRSE